MTSLFFLFLLSCLAVVPHDCRDFILPQHEHEAIKAKTPCPSAMDFIKCGCEFMQIGYVVDCDNLTWSELGQFASRYAASNLNSDFFLHLNNFHGDALRDFPVSDEQTRDKLATHWKSLSILGGENLTALPDLSWVTSLEEIELQGLTGLSMRIDSSLNDSSSSSFFPLPPNLRYLILQDLNVSQVMAALTWPLQDALANLTYLEISGYGSLDLAGQPFRNMSTLTELHLTEGRLTGLSAAAGALRGLQNLQILNLSANGLRDLPGGLLRDMADLEVLDISYNDLTAIPEEWLELNMELRDLRMRWNDISAIPAKLFDTTHQLATLDLSENYIHTLPAKIFKNNSKLSSLNLRDNNVAKLVDGVFEPLQNLSLLDLGQNLITSLSARAFRGLNRLERLNLTRNYIGHIARDAFHDLRSIQHIDLSHNRLTILRNGMFAGMTANFTSLDLSGNKMQHVEMDALESLNVAQLNIAGNSFTCSCLNVWLKDYLTSPTFCVDPRDMTIQNFDDLTVENCAPVDGRFITTNQEGLFFAGSVLFLATIFLALGIVCVLSQRARRVFYPTMYHDSQNFTGSDFEIKTISTSL